MESLTIKAVCPKCDRQIEVEVRREKLLELLREILRLAGHQPGDISYRLIMEQLTFAGE